MTDHSPEHHDITVPVTESAGALDRYLAGEASSAEAQRVEAWFAAHPETSAMSRMAKTIAVDGPLGDPSEAEIDAKWQILARQIETTPPRRVSHRKPRSSSWGLRAGASLMGVAAAVGIWAWTSGNGRDAQHDAQHAGLGAASNVYATTRSQYATVELPDGSSATLAPLTQVRYTESSRGERIIHLQGQAFFSVQHDPNHPITVRTGHVATRVLGTEFDIQRYTDDAETRVTVLSGKVSSGGKQAVTLTQGEMAIVSDSGIIQTPVSMPTPSRWWEGELTFTDTPVPTMLASLSRWYGYDFQLADSSLVKQYVTATFLVGKPVETLETLQALLGVTVTRTGNTILLSPGITRSDSALQKRNRDILVNTQLRVGR